ncbi:MAG: alpha/beta-type small acid-soluble spore protein [Christensenellales bacterium]|mgnify:CR=1 FL=1|jgi:small acid-soluble spore protein D (minor alpha/beta-type SASP)|nr:alpha/beta-type small acid-soluble spore protein [Clostridiales bacterium]MDY4201384.1 alpha/beta-type small acid-soluble spore protein [Candidatus Fimadaptatus sp.]
MQNQNQTNNSSSRINVPGARQALNNMKQEIANELGVNLKQGYNGDLTSREAGSIGGGMVKKMIEQQERQMSGQNQNNMG